MNTSEDDPEETIKGIHAADLLARGLESAKAATGNPQAWQPPTPEELAALLPQYEIETLLGRGGMGAVYRGKQAALDRPVAIKLLPAELAADAEFVNRFQREARTLAKLQHPGIVAVHDFGQTSAGHLYFVMEFVNGTDLARLIHGPGINPAQALEIITQICDALQYAHSQGVIHRDIKPANVLLTQEGRAKLADFGLARPVSEETAGLTRSHIVMGTPDYMAPEQMAGTADHRADLYALGVMLYEMLTGKTPRGAWAPPSQRVEVDVRLDQVVVRALQQDPAMRYQQASEIKTDVDVIRTTPPRVAKVKAKSAPAAPGQRTTPMPKAKKPVNRMAWAAAIVLPLLALAGWWGAQKSRELATANKAPALGAIPALWKPLPMVPKLASEAQANNGWIQPFRWYPPNVGQFTDGAVRLAYRWTEGAQLWIDLRTSDRTKVELKLNRDGQTALIFWKDGMDSSRSDLKIPAPKVGDEGTLELAIVGTNAFAKVNGQPLSLAGLSPSWMGTITIGAADSEKAPALKDVQYAILDGIADPLKALGWEVATAEPSTIPWTRIERSVEEWAKTGQTLQDDGWVHNQGKAFILFDRLSAAKATSQFAFRTQVIFHDKESRLSLASTNGGGSRLREAVFWPNKQSISNGSASDAQRHPTIVEPGEAAQIEILVAGDKAYTRFNRGPVVEVDQSPLILWEKCHLLTDKSYSLRDIEYAILDGIDEPLKALGWEFPRKTEALQDSLWQKSVVGEKDLSKLSPDRWMSFVELDGFSIHESASSPVQLGDGAFRAEVRLSRKGDSGSSGQFSIYVKNIVGAEGIIAFVISETELIVKRTPWMRPEDQVEHARMVFDTPFSPGDTELIEAAFVGGAHLVRFKGKELRIHDPHTIPSGPIRFHGRHYQVGAIEYAILDGIDEPWKALGWEKPESTEQSEIDLLALIDPSKDAALISNSPNRWAFTSGTLNYLSPGATGQIGVPLEIRSSHYQMEVEFDADFPPFPQTGTSRIHFYLPTDKEGFHWAVRVYGNGTLRVGPLDSTQINLRWSDQPASRGRVGVNWDIRDPKKARLEVLRDGQIVDQWEGDPSSFAGSILNPHPELGLRSLPALFSSGNKVTFKSFKLTLFEGEAQTLRGSSKTYKAASHSPGASVSEEKGGEWRDFLAEIENGPRKNEQFGQVWKPENGHWRVKDAYIFTLPDDAGRDLAVRISGILAPGKQLDGSHGNLAVTVRRRENANYTGILFNTGNAYIRLGAQDLIRFAIGTDFDPTVPHHLELREESDRLTLVVDEVELGSVQDSTLPPGGSFGVKGSSGSLIEKAEYRFLNDGSSPAAAW